MKIDLQSLSSEPLIYMLMHSGAFVTVLGVVFFIIGILFGRATWGRYKRQTRELQGEAEAMKEEIASLKRKLGEFAVKSGPAVSMMTETIHMPKREELPKPAALSALHSNGQTNGAAAPSQSAATPPAAEKPARSRGTVIKSKTSTKANQTALGEGTPPKADVVEASLKPEASTAAAPEMVPAAELAAPSRHGSALASIIGPVMKREGDLPLPAKDQIPVMLPEIPPPATVIIREPPVTLEIDPDLGPIYKSRPERVDDLTALKGVAHGLEQRLHALGVYTYAQIAGWTKDHIREFSSRLAFKDRIQREEWVEQAQALVAKATVEPTV